jgi:hypothetical protein
MFTGIMGWWGVVPPSPKLSVVIDQLDDDPSKTLDVVAKLRHEDTELLKELIVFYWRAEAIRKSVLGPDDLYVALSMNILGKLYYSQGQYRLAEPLIRHALIIMEKAPVPHDPDIRVLRKILKECEDTNAIN